jgi:hypothetical protein
MFEVFSLLTAGVVIGRLWAWRKANRGAFECPRCAVEDRTRNLLTEINGLKQHGQEAMQRLANDGRPAAAPRHAAPKKK